MGRDLRHRAQLRRRPDAVGQLADLRGDHHHRRRAPGSGGGATGTYEKNHGYVYEVFPGRSDQQLPKPIKAFGRFEHEAIAVEPSRTRAYLTEDASGPNGLVYRWTRPRGVRLRAGIANKLDDTAGAFEAMQILLDDGSVLPDVAYITSAQLGRPFKVAWTAVPDRDATSDPDPQPVRRRHRDPGQEVRGHLERRPRRLHRQQLRVRRHRPARPTPRSTTAWSGTTTTPTRRSPS